MFWHITSRFVPFPRHWVAEDEAAFCDAMRDPAFVRLDLPQPSELCPPALHALLASMVEVDPARRATLEQLLQSELLAPRMRELEALWAQQGGPEVRAAAAGGAQVAVPALLEVTAGAGEGLGAEGMVPAPQEVAAAVGAAEGLGGAAAVVVAEAAAAAADVSGLTHEELQDALAQVIKRCCSLLLLLL
jgi:hypothetical protein